MGYIKEPNGVDFIIQGKPLTSDQKQTISDYIKADKERTATLKKPDSKSVNRQHTRTKNKA
ncbi:hypothetical protein GCM10028773_36360 [Spirosoma koreense]